jgi:FeS assembly SUF system protein
MNPADPTHPDNRQKDPASAPATPSGAEDIREKVIEQLRTVYDPEIPVDIYQLGLVYDVSVDDEGAAVIQMTLTSPMCPVAEELPIEVEAKARSVEGVTSVQIDLVWDPPWDPSKMSEAARLELGMI